MIHTPGVLRPLDNPTADEVFLSELGARLAPTKVNEELREEADRLADSLLLFMQHAWHVIEPDAPFTLNWHIEAMCEHLEAVTAGEIRNLLINVPPGTTKSITASVMWPVWVWLKKPSWRWLTASHSKDLSTRDAVKSRRILESDWFRERWPIYLDPKQNRKTRYDNTDTGYRLAISVPAGTGEKGDTILCDDPHNMLGAESEAERATTIDWWNRTMSTRLNEPATGSKVIVMQRLHDADLSAIVLEQGTYEHLMLPMRYDEERACVTSLGFEDPRVEEGELLDPVRFPEAVVESLEVELGPYGTAGQLQQTPSARSGGMFEREWFEGQVVDVVPRNESVVYVGYIDKAHTKGNESGSGKTKRGPKNSAIGLFAYRTDTGHFTALHVRTGQWARADREARIDSTMREWWVLLGNDPETHISENGVEVFSHEARWPFKVWIEEEPAGGKESAELTVERLQRDGFTAATDRATVDKFVRADGFAGCCKARMFWMLRGDWNTGLVSELENAGPGALFLDQMDVCSGAYNKARRVKGPPATAPVAGTRPSPTAGLR